MEQEHVGGVTAYHVLPSESRHFLSELDRFLAKHLRFSARPAAEPTEQMRTALDLGVH